MGSDDPAFTDDIANKQNPGAGKIRPASGFFILEGTMRPLL